MALLCRSDSYRLRLASDSIKLGRLANACYSRRDLNTMHNIERLESEIAKELQELERIQGVLRNIKGSQPELDLQQEKENLRPVSRVLAKPPLKPDLSMKMTGSGSENVYAKLQGGPKRQRSDVLEERPPLKPQETQPKRSRRQLSAASTPGQSDTETNSQIELPDSRFQSSEHLGLYENTGKPVSRRMAKGREEFQEARSKARAERDSPANEQMYESLQEFLVLERQQSTQEPKRSHHRGKEDSSVPIRTKPKKDKSRDWARISSSETSVESGEDGLMQRSMPSEHQESESLKHPQIKHGYPKHVAAPIQDDEIADESQESPSKSHPNRQNSRRKRKATGYVSDDSHEEEDDDDYGALIKVSDNNKPVSRIGAKLAFHHQGNIQKTSREGSASKRSTREPKSSKKKGWTFSHEKRKSRSPEKSSVTRNDHLQNFCHMLGERLLTDEPNFYHHNAQEQHGGPGFQNKVHMKSRNHAQVQRDSAETSHDMPSGQNSHRQHKARDRRTVTDIGMAEYEEMCSRFREARMEAKTFDDKVKLLVLEVV